MQHPRQDEELYVNCSCINNGGSSYPGLCRPNCTMLYPFIGLMLVTGFLSTISAMPFIIFIIRAVTDKDKSLAIGVSTFLQTLLGFFPGPIIVGKIVDSTCVLWTSSCSKQGACALHDNDQLRIKISTIIAVAKSLTLILTVLIYWFSRHKTDWSVEVGIGSHKHAETERFLDKETEMKELEQMSRETSLKLKDIEHDELKTFGSHK
ncbi:hypothetical protein KUTeg_000396 [Tegillarca granosa]|uniref:Uncharacterized protein n=1 Tax=Tegillarca granosa TaxID=220873 RepID=A0ABQ9G077_TEGGR|nr:hypothetical protein KUTeg_000396 [Tegillarca granosa]